MHEAEGKTLGADFANALNKGVLSGEIPNG
jgi:hypothetical protein